MLTAMSIVEIVVSILGNIQYPIGQFSLLWREALLFAGQRVHIGHTPLMFLRLIGLLVGTFGAPVVLVRGEPSLNGAVPQRQHLGCLDYPFLLPWLLFMCFPQPGECHTRREHI